MNEFLKKTSTPRPPSLLFSDAVIRWSQRDAARGAALLAARAGKAATRAQHKLISL